MNLLVITNLYPPQVLGGYEILCQQVCSELQRRGHTVHVLTSGANGVGHQPDATPGVCRDLRLYLPFPEPARMARHRRWLTSRHNYRVTREQVARLRPDLVFVWSQLRLTLGAARAAQDSGRPVAFTLNDDHLAGYAEATWGSSPAQAARYVVDRLLLPSLTLHGLDLQHTTCISECLRQNLLRQGVAVADARVIHQGIPSERFPAHAPRPSLGGVVRILYVGQLHAYKGVHTLIAGVQQLARLRPRHAFELTIVGAGDAEYEHQLRHAARAGHVKVTFRGRVHHADLPAVYREHDLFVFPSEWQEPFGLTHLEAMSSGLPVVSTAHGGHGEFLRDGENALIFPPGREDLLAARLAELVDDDALRLRISKAGVDCVQRDFTLRRYVDRLEHWLDSILEKEATDERAARPATVCA